MTPIVLAQDPTLCPYATQMVTLYTAVGLDDPGVRYTAGLIAALPQGRRAVRVPDLHTAPQSNLDLIVRVFAAAGVVPDRVVLDCEGQGVGDPSSPLRQAIRRGLEPLRAGWPAALVSNYTCASCEAGDGEVVRDINDCSGMLDAYEFDEQAPSLYGWASSLIRHREVFASPYGMLAWQLSILHACYRAFARTGRSAPLITPWLAPRLCGLLDYARWRALMIHAVLRCGPTLRWFNGDCNGRRPDGELTAVLDEIAAQTRGGNWEAALGMRLTDRLAGPSATRLASFANLSDGTVAAFVTFSGLQQSCTLVVPQTGQTVKVLRDAGDFSGWARIPSMTQSSIDYPYYDAAIAAEADARQDAVTSLAMSISAKADALTTALAIESKAPANHAHTAEQISDATPAGRSLLVAPDAASQRSLLGVAEVDAASGTAAGLMSSADWLLLHDGPLARTDAANEWDAPQQFNHPLEVTNGVSQTAVFGPSFANFYSYDPAYDDGSHLTYCNGQFGFFVDYDGYYFYAFGDYNPHIHFGNLLDLDLSGNVLTATGNTNFNGTLFCQSDIVLAGCLYGAKVDFGGGRSIEASGPSEPWATWPDSFALAGIDWTLTSGGYARTWTNSSGTMFIYAYPGDSMFYVQKVVPGEYSSGGTFRAADGVHTGGGGDDDGEYFYTGDGAAFSALLLTDPFLSPGGSLKIKGLTGRKYADNEAALVAGVEAGTVYATPTGELRVAV